MKLEQQDKVLAVIAKIEIVGLVIIGIATIIAVGEHLWYMVSIASVKLQDLLLLFIYLEIFTMIGLYFKTGKLPLRYPIYIAIVAIARYIIIGMKEMEPWSVVVFSLAILVLTLAALAIRYGHTRMPYKDQELG